MKKEIKKIRPGSEIAKFLFYSAVVAIGIVFSVIGWRDTLINKFDWGFTVARLIDSINVVFGALLIAMITKYVVHIIYIGKDPRRQTLKMLIQSIFKYIIAIVALVFILVVWLGEEYVSSIIASLGVVALVIGLGLQSLISDIVAGIFMVFEGHINVGDTVTIDSWRGTVTEIGVRTTVITDWAGNEKVINNSSISSLINMSNNLSVAIVNVQVDYAEDIEKVEKVITGSFTDMKKKIPEIVVGPSYGGVSELGTSSVSFLVTAKCLEEDRFKVQRSMNKYFKMLLDSKGISIPFTQVMVSERKTKK